ncbi:hypothetical protein DBR32_10490 [Taibaiella sp. KBW10]|nr:hypothetical protein DBR32_10490 [Taibaiella sp. KBW10]
MTGFTLKAQIPFGKVDSIAKAISQFQLRSNNLVYNDGKNNYELNFPENNFAIVSGTGQAIKIINKKLKGTKFRYETEPIDLSKVAEVYQVKYPGRAGVLRMTFPEGVKTKCYTNETYTSTIREYYVEFFFDREDNTALNTLLTQLERLFSLLKLGKKIAADQYAQQENIASEKTDIQEVKSTGIVTVDELISKCIDAQGGAELLRSIKTMKGEGLMQAQGMTIPAKLSFLQNSGMRMDLEIQGRSNITVTSITGCWTLFPVRGQRRPVNADAIVAREGLEELDLTGDLFEYNTKGNKVELLGKEMLDGKDNYSLKITRKSGTIVLLLIDAHTFLASRRTIHKTIEGKFTKQIETYGDYKKTAEGFVYASSFYYSPSGMTLSYTTFGINEPVDPAIFLKP